MLLPCMLGLACQVIMAHQIENSSLYPGFLIINFLLLFFCMNRNLDWFITGESKKQFSNVMDIFNDFFHASVSQVIFEITRFHQGNQVPDEATKLKTLTDQLKTVSLVI